MGSHVSIFAVASREGPLTQITVVRLFTRVRSHVRLQGSGSDELLAAPLTNVVQLAGMNLLVRDYRRFAHQYFVT